MTCVTYIIIIYRYTENEDVIPENPSDVTELVCLAEQVGVPQVGYQNPYMWLLIGA